MRWLIQPNLLKYCVAWVELSHLLVASQGCKLVVGASRSLARSRRFETLPLQFFGFFEMLPISSDIIRGWIQSNLLN